MSTKSRKLKRKKMKVHNQKFNRNSKTKSNSLSSLIEKHKKIDLQTETIKGNKTGILCLFHDFEKGFSWGSQRIICEESIIKKTPNISKDDFIGMIDYLVRTENIQTSKKIGSSIVGYLPYTETWKISNLTIGKEKGFILNFYIHSKGISCRECYSMSYDSWVEMSKEEQYKLVG